MRRVELGLSMATVNDMAGTQDGFYGKMIYPDTPHGRQARWETVQDVIEALFGRGFSLQIVPDETENRRLLSAPSIDAAASANALKVRHWRHSKHFAELGALGAKARLIKMPAELRSKQARKAAKVRWKKARAAQRAGEQHKVRNASHA
ncbi:hypothetical protein IVB03_39445 [Bradyrhizobium sp. 168]|uniref:hypothetical protein n=1 Tax=Bradyrhizobium sp. 168 TaxID=2782639 RepID=UPI001FFA41AE|nr:hypothetical protein [Bradyrhizobium sp. 168]MCK1585471.1 hypothetical protein [Bradyrhizobium sp. 168]